MEEKTFEIEEILYVLRKKIWILVVITIITTSLGVLKVMSLKPTYVATAKVFIGRDEELLQIYTEQEIEGYSKFVGIFNELARLDGFLDDKLKKNNIDLSSSQVASGLSFSSSETIPVYNITYRSSTDKDIDKILNVVCDELIEKVKEIMPYTVPQILSESVSYPVYPNKLKLPIIAFIAGIVLSIGIIFVLDYLDDRIISKKQLEKVIPIPVLGDIPTYERQFKRREKNANSKSIT